MSIGYIPKKRAKAKKQRRLRKKYKNFSCETCAKREFGYKDGPCKKRYQSSRIGGIWVGNYENCEYWKADPNYNREQAELPKKKVLKKKKY